jgi:hypothetical protein
MEKMNPVADPKHDFDGRGCSIGTYDKDSDRIPKTAIEWSRSCNLLQREESPTAWKLSNVTVVDQASQFILVGLTEEDCRTLSDFFAECAQRLHDY